MKNKKLDASPPANVPDGRVIDLLLPVLSKLGITVSRATPDTLAGFIEGLLDRNVLLWSEIWGGGNEIHVQISGSKAYFEDQEADIRAQVERLNIFPEWGVGEGRWLKVAMTMPRPSGGRHVVLIAKIVSPTGDLTPEFCEEKIATIAEFIKKEWPRK